MADYFHSLIKQTFYGRLELSKLEEYIIEHPNIFNENNTSLQYIFMLSGWDGNDVERKYYENRKLDIIKLLLKYGANPNECVYGLPLLRHAVNNGYVDVVKLLLEYNATYDENIFDNIAAPNGIWKGISKLIINDVIEKTRNKVLSEIFGVMCMNKMDMPPELQYSVFNDF